MNTLRERASLTLDRIKNIKLRDTLAKINETYRVTSLLSLAMILLSIAFFVGWLLMQIVTYFSVPNMQYGTHFYTMLYPIVTIVVAFSAIGARYTKGNDPSIPYVVLLWVSLIFNLIIGVVMFFYFLKGAIGFYKCYTYWNGAVPTVNPPSLSLIGEVNPLCYGIDKTIFVANSFIFLALGVVLFVVTVINGVLISYMTYLLALQFRKYLSQEMKKNENNEASIETGNKEEMEDVDMTGENTAFHIPNIGCKMNDPLYDVRRIKAKCKFHGAPHHVVLHTDDGYVTSMNDSGLLMRSNMKKSIMDDQDDDDHF